MNKNIINFVLSVSIFATVISLPTPLLALTLDDINMLLNTEIINPTQASILMKNSYMFGGVTATGIITDTTTNSSTNNVSGGNCLNLSNIDLERSNRDNSLNNNSVSIVQNFLYKNGYLEVSPTGYFGSLTVAAVKAFQAANEIRTTGNVGPMTRAKIISMSCGGTSNVTTLTNTNYSDPNNPPVPGKADSLAPVITLAAEPANVLAGATSTLFWGANNAVGQCTMTYTDVSGKNYSSVLDYAGSSQIGPINSTSTYTFTCYNKYGIPGIKKLVVGIQEPVVVKEEVYAKFPHIDSVNPASGNRGTLVTLNGHSFLEKNEIIFDGLKLDPKYIVSQGSTSISFIIPEFRLCSAEYCPPPTVDTQVDTGGRKVIQLYNANGFGNDAYFTIPNNIVVISGVSIIPSYFAKFELSSITPTSGNRGDTITISGSGFSSDSVVMFGGFKVPNYLVTTRKFDSISFIVPPFQLGCTDPDYEVCPKVPIAGNGTVIETGGDKSVFVMNMSSKATTSSATFNLPLKQITY